MTTIDTFAIGDVHGRADLLERLLGYIAAIADQPYQVMFLGDLIDRGPDSKSAIELAIETVKSIPGSKLILGNHDHFPLRIIDEFSPENKERAIKHWLFQIGGDATVRSYGFEPNSFTYDDLITRFPAEHLAFIRNASHYVELDQQILVHAGLSPNVPLERQTLKDLTWITDPFLTFEGKFDKTVVHGHTVTPNCQPEIFGCRIGIDTGAYLSGILTAVHLIPGRSVPDFIGTTPEGSNVVTYWSLPSRRTMSRDKQPSKPQ
jgi:serine/threonine protein phosphatase 1